MVVVLFDSLWVGVGWARDIGTVSSPKWNADQIFNYWEEIHFKDGKLHPSQALHKKEIFISSTPSLSLTLPFSPTAGPPGSVSEELVPGGVSEGVSRKLEFWVCPRDTWGRLILSVSLSLSIYIYKPFSSPDCYRCRECNPS